jgi:hypothetical protein
LDEATGQSVCGQLQEAITIANDRDDILAPLSGHPNQISHSFLGTVIMTRSHFLALLAHQSDDHRPIENSPDDAFVKPCGCFSRCRARYQSASPMMKYRVIRVPSQWY